MSHLRHTHIVILNLVQNLTLCGAKWNELFPLFGGPELQVRSRMVLVGQSSHTARSMEHSHHFILSPRCSLWICPNFKVCLRQEFKKNEATELIVVTKVLVL